MKLAFDMDGTIAAGTYLDQPEDPHIAYMGLQPYDSYTKNVWNKICRLHDTYIITSRSFNGAVKLTERWLKENELAIPAGIISCSKYEKSLLTKLLAVDALFDDHPLVYRECVAYNSHDTFLMDNPGWVENQQQVTDSVNSRIKSWKEIYTILFNA